MATYDVTLSLDSVSYAAPSDVLVGKSEPPQGGSEFISFAAPLLAFGPAVPLIGQVSL